MVVIITLLDWLLFLIWWQSHMWHLISFGGPQQNDLHCFLKNKFGTKLQKVLFCYSNPYLVLYWQYLEHQASLLVFSPCSMMSHPCKIIVLWGTEVIIAEGSLLSLWHNCLHVARKVCTLETDLQAEFYWSWNKCFYIKQNIAHSILSKW